MRVLSTITRCDPDLGSGSALSTDELAAAVRITEYVDKPHRLLLSFKPGAAALVDVEIDGRMSSQARMTIKLTYDDASVKWFRIIEAARRVWPATPGTIEGQSLWADLADAYPRRTLTGGTKDHTITRSGVTAQTVLTDLFTNLDAPSYFTAGTVAGAINTDVDILLDGTTSFLQALREMARQVGGEVEFVDGASSVTVNIVESIGTEASPEDRPIELGGTSESNRRELYRRSEGASYFNRVIPLGGTDGETVTIGQALWSISSAVFAAGSTTITFDGTPIWEDDALIGMYFGTTGSWYVITDSTAENQIVVTGDASALTSGRFALDNTGTELTYLEMVDSADDREKAIRYSSVPAFANILADQGISADFSSWSGGLPDGWNKINGAETVSQETDTRYTKYGSASAKVIAGTIGYGLKTDALTLAPTDSLPYHSAWLFVRVTAGKIGLFLVDDNGTEHPIDDSSYSNEDRLVAIVIAGMDPVASSGATLEIRALEASTTFYADAVTLTNSSGAYAYADSMGPTALWKEAAKELLNEGGILPDAYEGLTIDANIIDGVSYPNALAIGDTVRVRDAYDPSTDNFDISFDNRVVELDYEEHLVDGARMKSFRLSRLRRDITSRFTPAARRGDLPVIPPKVKPSKPRVRPDTFDRTDAGTRYGVMRLYVDDPHGLVDDVAYRSAEGDNIPSGTSWTGGVGSAADGDGTYYEVKKELHEDHKTTIQMRVELKPPYEDIKDWIQYSESYDFNPLANVSWNLLGPVWDNVNEAWIFHVAFDGDTDTLSAETKYDEGGPVLETQYVNARSGVIIANAGNPLAPGDTATIECTGYNATGGSGGSGDASTETASFDVEGPEVQTGQIADGAILFRHLTEAAQRFGSDMVFSATDYNTVAWTSDDIVLGDGTTYAINAGNTGNMTALTYIYLDTAVSSTVLQTTTTLANAIGEGKILICIAKDAADSNQDAFYVPGVGILGINEEHISAYSISTDKLQANAVTAAKINVVNLNAVSTDTGALTVDDVINISTSGVLRSGATAYLTGTGYFLEYNAGTPRGHFGNPSGSHQYWSGSEYYLRLGGTEIVFDDDGIAMSSGGIFRSGATAILTGTGYYFDNNAGTPRARVGNPSGSYAYWQGTELYLNFGSSEIIIDDDGINLSGSGGTIKSGATAWMTGAGYWLQNDAGDQFFRVGDPSGDYIKYDTSSTSFIYKGDAGAITLSSSGLELANGGALFSGASAILTGTGYWFDNSGGTPRARVGNPSGSYIYWQGTELYLRLGGTEIIIDDDGINLSGSGATIKSGATAYMTGAGFWLQNDAGTAFFRVGDPSGDYLSWSTGLDIVCGGGEVTIDDDGITIAYGSGAANKITFGTSTQSHIQGLTNDLKIMAYEDIILQPATGGSGVIRTWTDSIIEMQGFVDMLSRSAPSSPSVSNIRMYNYSDAIRYKTSGGTVHTVLTDQYEVFTLKEQSGDPSTPATGYWKLYFKSDGLYHKEDDGTVTGPIT